MSSYVNDRQADVRVDEDAQEAYDSILRLLLAAGYFRVRVVSLTPFDKVIGGLAWCIAQVDVDADVDVVFRENASIKQKLDIAASIIASLNRNKCPVKVEPHQIQGSDFNTLFPIFRWLVKKVIETRQETGDVMRSFSELQFGKRYLLPQDAAARQRTGPATTFLGACADRYAPVRKFKPAAGSVERRERDERAKAALLEYGHTYRLSDANDADLEGVQATRITANTMAAILGESEAIRGFADEFGIGTRAKVEAMGKEEAHKRAVAALQRQIEERGAALAALQAKFEAAEQMVEEGRGRLMELIGYNARAVTETEKLQALETEENTEMVQRIRSNLSLHDNFQAHVAAFKASCMAQLEEMNDQIAALSTGELPPDVRERFERIEAQWESDKDKLERMQAALARKSREITMLYRKMDEIPSRGELNQYQRRILELRRQIANKETETRRYFDTYNMLSFTKEYSQREVDLLESILQSYPKSMRGKSTKNKEAFVKHMQDMAASLEKNMGIVTGRFDDEKGKYDARNTEYHELLDKEREFYRVSKEFREACKLNELLIRQVGDIGAVGGAGDDDDVALIGGDDDDDVGTSTAD